LRAAAARAARARVEFRAGSIGFDELRSATDEEVALLRQTGSALGALWSLGFQDVATWLTSDDQAVELVRRERVRLFDAPGSAGGAFLANSLGEWAISLCRIGEIDAARGAVERGRGLAQDDDIADQIMLDLAEAFVCALTGEADAARALVDRAGRNAEGIDMVPVTDELDYEAAGIAAILGDTSGAWALLEGLVERAETLGLNRFADRYRQALGELG